MNVISGKIVVKETGIGVPDLIVEVYDLDPKADLGEVFTGIAEPDGGAITVATTAKVPTGRIPADRIGAVITDATGSFELEYDDAELRIRNKEEARPDLLVVVVAPDVGPASRGMELYRSALVRENAGRREELVVRIPTDFLTKAEISLPTGAQAQPSVERVRDGLLGAEERQRRLVEEGVRVVQRARVDRVRPTADTLQAQVLPALRRSLSRATPAQIASGSLVQPGESVHAKSHAKIRSGVADIINDRARQQRVKTRRLLSLTPEQREQVRAHEQPDGTVPASAVGDVLRAASRPWRRVRDLVRVDPTHPVRRRPSETELTAARLLGVEWRGEEITAPQDPPGHNGTTALARDDDAAGDLDIGGNGVSALTDGQVKTFAARLVSTLTSPEEAVLAELEPRATRDGVATSLGELALPPSPADNVAFHDFNTLQIAFEHVWQEIPDEGVLRLAEHAFYEIVERGGDPSADVDALLADPLGVLVSEGRRVLLAGRVEAATQGTLGVSTAGADPSLLPPQTMARRRSQGSPDIRDHRDNPQPWTPSNDPPPPRVPGGLPGDHEEEEDPLPSLLAQLQRRRNRPYPFTVFAANDKERSVNFGLLTTYRQTWEPQAYQAGKLARTATLAPRETAKYTKKTTTHEKRSTKEVENHLRVRKSETTQTSRAEHEIVRKARLKTNFDVTAQDAVKIPLTESVGMDHTQTTQFKREAEKTSEDVKKAFHEAVFKAAQEYKDETTTEVAVEQSTDVEITESGEITNPNDEIAVTFLFYELQRRYKVSEKLHRLTPVVLVAQEVPNPADIDGDWVLAHDWILRRCILDDSFLPAITHLVERVVGDEVALGQLKKNVDTQRELVTSLQTELAGVRDRLTAYRGIAEGSVIARGRWSSGSGSGSGGGDGGGLFSGVPVIGSVLDGAVDMLGDAAAALGDFFGGGDSDSTTKRDALNEATQKLTDLERDAIFRLEREVTALNATMETYSKLLTEHFNQQAQIHRLFVHIKENILYYMQAIWTHEPPDQRFFRLHQVPVPVFEVRSETYAFTESSTVPLVQMAHRRMPWIEGVVGESVFEAEVGLDIDPAFQTAPLVDVAELDNLLGFKGNYMIFPLKESNPITDYMMAPYVLEGLDELIDPDAVGNWTLDEFATYVVDLKARLTEDQFADVKDDLLAQYKQLLAKRLRDGEILTVPTGALFIEALPAGHSLIERFKALHRALDVKRAQAEVRRLELENLRYAARLVGGEHEDPDVERKIVIDGPGTVVVPPEA